MDGDAACTMAGPANSGRQEEALELGTFRGQTEPGAESDSAQARLLSEERSGGAASERLGTAHYSGAIAPVLSYCAASISMTVINKVCVGA